MLNDYAIDLDGIVPYSQCRLNYVSHQRKQCGNLDRFRNFIAGSSCVRAYTAWLTLFKRGELLMTQPTSIFFGPDGGFFESSRNKVYLRTLLYSSSRKGQVVESMHVTLERGKQSKISVSGFTDGKGISPEEVDYS